MVIKKNIRFWGYSFPQVGDTFDKQPDSNSNNKSKTTTSQKSFYYIRSFFSKFSFFSFFTGQSHKSDNISDKPLNNAQQKSDLSTNPKPVTSIQTDANLRGQSHKPDNISDKPLNNAQQKSNPSTNPKPVTSIQTDTISSQQVNQNNTENTENQASRSMPHTPNWEFTDISSLKQWLAETDPDLVLENNFHENYFRAYIEKNKEDKKKEKAVQVVSQIVATHSCFYGSIYRTLFPWKNNLFTKSTLSSPKIDKGEPIPDDLIQKWREESMYIIPGYRCQEKTMLASALKETGLEDHLGMEMIKLKNYHVAPRGIMLSDDWIQTITPEIKSGSSIVHETPGNGNNSLLQIAIANNKNAFAELLLQHKADPNYTNDFGATALTYAIENIKRQGNNYTTNQVSLLLNHNANPQTPQNSLKDLLSSNENDINYEPLKKILL